MFSPELCKAGRSLLGWSAEKLASAANVGLASVRRFESGRLVRPATLEAMFQALQGAGLEFIPVGGLSLGGGAGVRSQPIVEPEVAAAQEAVELELDQDLTLTAPAAAQSAL